MATTCVRHTVTTTMRDDGKDRFFWGEGRVALRIFLAEKGAAGQISLRSTGPLAEQTAVLTARV